MKFLKIFMAVIIALAIVIITSLLITACIQNVSPLVQWNNWMEALGFIKKSSESASLFVRWL